MATFTYNNGTPANLDLSRQAANAAITLSAAISFTDPDTKIAGHSVINLDGQVDIQDVQFEAYSLGNASALNGKKLALIVNVSKFAMAASNVASSNVATTTTAVTCTVTVAAGGTPLESFELSDSAYAENNAVFIYIFSCSTQPS